MLLHLRQRLGGFGFVTHQPEQADKPLQRASGMPRAGEADTAFGQLPALFQTSLFEQVGRQLEDEFFAIGRVGEVNRIVRIDQQQLAGHIVMLIAATA
ncbi:hypothetical protein D3C79_960810 [compost metagenome]